MSWAGKKNFFRMVTCSGVARSNCTLPSGARDKVNSGSDAASGFCTIAPIGMRSDEFKISR